MHRPPLVGHDPLASLPIADRKSIEGSFSSVRLTPFREKNTPSRLSGAIISSFRLRYVSTPDMVRHLCHVEENVPIG